MKSKDCKLQQAGKENSGFFFPSLMYRFVVVAFGLIPAIFYCTLFFFIAEYFSRQSDTGTIDNVM